jgi:hypothetical protein
MLEVNLEGEAAFDGREWTGGSILRRLKGVPVELGPPAA